jgi:hypothetical protein
LDPSPGACADCGKELDGWTAIKPGTRPQANGKCLSICSYYGTLHEFVGSPLRLRRLTEDELTLALIDPTIHRAVRYPGTGARCTGLLALVWRLTPVAFALRQC